MEVRSSSKPVGRGATTTGDRERIRELLNTPAGPSRVLTATRGTEVELDDLIDEIQAYCDSPPERLRRLLLRIIETLLQD